MRALALVILVGCSQRSAAPAPADDAFLAIGVLDGPSPLMRFTQTGADGATVTGELWGSRRTYPRDQVIPMRAIDAEPPPAAGDLVVVRVNDAYWDLGLLAGLDGDTAYVREDDGLHGWPRASVHRIPDLAALADARAGLALAARAHAWSIEWPPGWTPRAGDAVLERRAGAWPTVTIADVRGGVARTREWLTVRRLVPPPDASSPHAGAGDVIASIADGKTGEVLAADGAGVDARFVDGSRAHLAHTAYVRLRPPADVTTPVTPWADATVIERTEAFRELEIELDVADTRITGDRIAFIDARGAALVTAHAQLLDDDPGAWSADTYERLADRASNLGAAFLAAHDRHVYAVLDPHLATPPPALALSAPARAALAALR